MEAVAVAEDEGTEDGGDEGPAEHGGLGGGQRRRPAKQRSETSSETVKPMPARIATPTMSR